MSNARLSPSPKQRGFTIVEMLVIAPIVILTIGAFITAIVNMTGDVLASRGSNVLAYGIQDALNHIENDVKLSTGFLAVNNITLSANNPQGYGDDTTNFTNVDTTKGDMLILNTLATTNNPISSTGGLVYLNDQPNNCSTNAAQVNQNTPMTMNVVYYVKTVGSVSSLWRRTIAPLDYSTAGATTAGCNISPWQQPSCTPGNTHAFCITQDIRLLDGINPNDFIVQYFNTADATTADNVASDTGSTDSVRSAALQTNTTVGATINITKNIAGRVVSQVGTLRATRLDVNASTIAPIVPDVIPAAPTVTASVNQNAPNGAVFTWATVPGATTYTFEYQINGGSWTTGFTSENETTYSVPAFRTDVVSARVTAISGAGSSGYGTSSITIPAWTALQLENGWVRYQSPYNPSFTKTSDGVVVIRAMIKKSTAPADLETIATLPPGYRPSHRIRFTALTNGNALGGIDITADGRIRFRGGSNVWMSFEGTTFIPDDGRYTPTNVATFFNGWVNYGSDLAPASYVVDDSGRVHLQGMVKNGVMTSGTKIHDVPSELLPSQAHIFPAVAGGSVFSSFRVSASTSVYTAGVGSNEYLTTQGMYHPGVYSGWSNLSLQSSWVNYGSVFTTAQYTKAADGMVKLKGLIKSGSTTAGTTITTLPAGYRPANYMVYKVTAYSSATVIGRVDIRTDGVVLYQGGGNGWLSLDGVQFMGDL